MFVKWKTAYRRNRVFRAARALAKTFDREGYRTCCTVEKRHALLLVYAPGGEYSRLVSVARAWLPEYAAMDARPSGILFSMRCCVKGDLNYGQD